MRTVAVLTQSCAPVLLLFLGWATARAEIADLQEVAQDHPALTHQYSFDGADPFERRQNSIGVDELVEQAGGIATFEDITYGVAGFDESSEAVTTFRPVPSTNEFADGANFRIPSIALGEAFSFEVIFRPGEEVIEGGDFNLGYILANRIDNDRGYFLLQGSSEQDEFGAFGRDGDDIANIIGTFSTDNENTLLETVDVGHWYYAAGSYFYDANRGETTFTNYLADLTSGQIELTVVGPTTIPGSYGRDFTGLSIGGRFDGPGEGFPGDIDEVNLYDDALEDDEFEEHLAAIYDGAGPPATLFHRGDADDSGALNITDAVFIFDFLFLGGTPPSCREAADANDDEGIDLSDGIGLLNFLFLGGPPPAAPGPPPEPCGELEAESPLSCEEYTSCG